MFRTLWRLFPNLFYLKLYEWPEGFGFFARNDAVEVVSGWVLGADKERSYETLLLIEEHKMAGAVPALRELAQRFEAIPTLNALRDLRRVQRCIESLGDEAKLPAEPETKFQQFRREMANHWQLVYDETNPRIDGYDIRRQLAQPFSRFDAAEREMAETILSQWILSDDENVRVDARHVIEDCRLVATLPSLSRLDARLAKIKTGSAEDERAHVRRVIADLTQ